MADVRTTARPFRRGWQSSIRTPSRSRFHFRPGRGGNGELPPNNWQSVFGGPAWTRVADGEWYLHLFAPQQPDFDWEHPAVRDEFRRVESLEYLHARLLVRGDGEFVVPERLSAPFARIEVERRGSEFVEPGVSRVDPAMAPPRLQGVGVEYPPDGRRAYRFDDGFRHDDLDDVGDEEPTQRPLMSRGQFARDRLDLGDLVGGKRPAACRNVEGPGGRSRHSPIACATGGPCSRGAPDASPPRGSSRRDAGREGARDSRAAPSNGVQCASARPPGPEPTPWGRTSADRSGAIRAWRAPPFATRNRHAISIGTSWDNPTGTYEREH